MSTWELIDNERARVADRTGSAVETLRQRIS
jgi:hypothetical protein